MVEERRIQYTSYRYMHGTSSAKPTLLLHAQLGDSQEAKFYQMASWQPKEALYSLEHVYVQHHCSNRNIELWFMLYDSQDMQRYSFSLRCQLTHCRKMLHQCSSGQRYLDIVSIVGQNVLEDFISLSFHKFKNVFTTLLNQVQQAMERLIKKILRDTGLLTESQRKNKRPSRSSESQCLLIINPLSNNYCFLK